MLSLLWEKEALQIWDIIKMRFRFPVDDPTSEEIEIINAYERGDAEYQPFISHEELKRELGLE